MTRAGLAGLMAGWIFLVGSSSCFAGTVTIDVVTSFPISMLGDDEAGDLAYNPTSNTLLIVPGPMLDCGEPVTPYYREYSTTGTLLRTVVLPHTPFDLPEAERLGELRVFGIELNPSDMTLYATQCAQIIPGPMEPPYYWACYSVFALPPGMDSSFVDLVCVYPDERFCGTAFDPARGELGIFAEYRNRFPPSMEDTLGPTFEPDEKRLYAISRGYGSVTVYAYTYREGYYSFYAVRRVADTPLPPVLSAARGIAHFQGDLFWITAPDRVFLAKLTYRLPADTWAAE